MRLTLRTLLAYLDDILEPAQAEEIRNKIRESGFASTLVNRIREVLRRRRLPAPDIEGPNAGLDPNVVAEYLDNTLEPSAVADVERVCLDSDVHLAEVAACHHILTMVLGEPVDVPPRTRERMYALVESQGEADQPSEQPGSAGTGTEQSGQLSQTTTTRFTDLLPDYLKPPPLWRRLLPYALVLLLVAAWLSLFALDPTVWQSIRAALGWQAGSGAESVVSVQTEPGELGQSGSGAALAPPSAPVGQVAGKPQASGTAGGAEQGTASVQLPAKGESLVVSSEPATGASQAGEPSETTSSVEAQPAGGGSPSSAAMATPSTEPVATESGEQSRSAVAPSELDTGGPSAAVAGGSSGQPGRLAVSAQGTEESIPSTTETVRNTRPAEVAAASVTSPTALAPVGSVEGLKPPGEPSSAAGPAAPAGGVQSAVTLPSVQYTSPSGVLLRYSPEDEDWVLLPHRALLMPGEQFVCPEPFLAHLRVNKGLLRIVLRGGTRVSLLAPTAEVPLGFEVLEGRIVFDRQPAVDPAAMAARVVLAIRVHEETWRLELAEPGTVCGLEIVRRMPDQPDQDFGPDAYLGGLYVAQGSVRFADGTHPEQMLKARQWLPLRPSERKSVAQTGTLPPLFGVPEWLEAKDDYITDVQRRYAEVFEREFQPDVPVSLLLPTVVRSPRPWLSEFATKCLALTDHYRLLVQALAESSHHEARLAAIEGLRRWLPTAPDNGKKLKEALADFFHSDEVDVVYRLLWGFNEKDASNPFWAKQLVDWLEHDHVAVRELAFYHIYRLTKQRYDYRPDAPLSQRQASVARWRQHLKRNNGQLLGL